MAVEFPNSPAYHIPLSDKELALIGKFVLSWNQIEMFMELIVHLITGLNTEIVSKVMGSPNIRPQVEILDSIIRGRITDPGILRKSNACTKRILDLSNFRNSVVHSNWFGSDPDNALGAKDFISKNHINVNDLSKNLDLAMALSRRIADLFWNIAQHLNPQTFGAPSPWHDRF